MGFTNFQAPENWCETAVNVWEEGETFISSYDEGFDNKWLPNWCLAQKPLTTHWLRVFSLTFLRLLPDWTNELYGHTFFIIFFFFWPFFCFLLLPQWTWKTKTWMTSWTTTGSALYPCRLSPKLYREVPKQEKKKNVNTRTVVRACPVSSQSFWTHFKAQKRVTWRHLMPGPDCT